MVITFGAPMDEVELEKRNEEGTGRASAESDPPQNLLDINDPRFTSEDVTVNVDGDAYAQPAPPPDGKYRVKLKLAQKDVAGQKMDYIAAEWGKQSPQAVLVTGVEASIIDPSGKYDGLKAYDFNVSTFIGRDSNTKVATILSKLRQPNGERWVKPGRQLKRKEWMDTLVKALAGEPEVGIETAWEYSCQECGKEAKEKGNAYPKSVVGMHRFPAETDADKRRAGQAYSPEMKCPVNPAHGYGRARITINRFLALSELK